MKKLIPILLLSLSFSLAQSATNLPPKISGTPTTIVNVGKSYTFKPIASDPEGKKLNFVIANKPHWLSFSYSTGSITGTPKTGDVGTYSNITIYAKDGVNTTALKKFSIAVKPKIVVPPTTYTANISWIPPTENTDGTPLTDLSGYKILYGKSSTSLNQSITVNNASASTFVVDSLDLGTYYFAVRAVNSKGVESFNSNITSKIIQ